ncbi:MAG: SDR family oxidoreductase [Proteobacteria bacterium]|nr:SDR family oxidoreductase [Pseudomonadota bacterium]
MNQIDLAGRAAVVTGGARGIGLAIAARLIASGARVALWDRDGATLTQGATSLQAGEAVMTAVVDVTDEASVGAAAQAARARFGKIDILVNNAGITGGNAKSWDLAPADWRQVLDVNLTGPFLTCRAIVPGMMAARYGRVVNVASIAGKEGNPNAAHYSASKAGVIALTKSIAKETADAGVIVNCITPAAVRTAMFDQMSQAHIDFMLSRIPMGRFGKVEELAALVAWLASEECSFSTGAAFDISGGRATY